VKLITAIVKPEVTDDLVSAVAGAGARGLTATEVIGFGQQYGRGSQASSARHSAALLPKVRVDIVIPDEFVDAVVSAIAKCANTGSIGDGKIWVSPVDSALRVRTGERDNSSI
jgi:nitrogen regulatory protein P-II 1